MKYKFGSIIILIVLAAGFIYYSRSSSTPPLTNDGEERTLSGEYVCLPHKDTSGPQTLECALGLKLDDGSYYALNISQFLNSSSTFNYATGDRLKVTGKLINPSDLMDKYVLDGVIEVQRAEKE